METNPRSSGYHAAGGPPVVGYQGKAWYRRTIQLPADWAGQRIWLCLGGTGNTADVYLNGVLAGTVDSFITPYEFDVTAQSRPGLENTIAWCVDSASPAPVGMFNFVGRWGGLYRQVYLEARSDPAIDDLFVSAAAKGVSLRDVAASALAAGSEPRNRWKLFRVSMICEGQVGSGRLLVCSFRVLDGVRNGAPEAGYLLDCLIDYALSDRPALDVPPMTPEETRTVFLAKPAASE